MTKFSQPQPGADSTTVQNAKENPGKPTEAARNPQTGDIQKDWNSVHPGGVATIEDPPEYTPSNADPVTQANSSHSSEAAMRYNPRYNAEDLTQEDASVAGDPIKRTDTTGQSREKSDD